MSGGLPASSCARSSSGLSGSRRKGKTLAEDIKEVFAEAKGNGFDTKIIREIIKIRRMDEDDLDEQVTLLDIYKRALGMLPDVPESAAAE
jgi:hypothetical protein